MFGDSPYLWHVYIALIFASVAVLFCVASRWMFGVDPFLTGLADRLCADQERRLQSVFASGFGGAERVRRAGYWAAGIALLMAGLGLLPGIAPAIPLAVGFFGLGAGTVVAYARLSGNGPRRVAALVRRSIPRPIVLSWILAIGGTLGLALDPSLRIGAAFVVMGMLCLCLLAVRVAFAPLRLRGEDTALESAVAEIVRRSQVCTISSLAVALATMNWAISVVAPHVHSWIFSAAYLPICAASIIVSSSTKKARDVRPILGALEASPA